MFIEDALKHLARARWFLSGAVTLQNTFQRNALLSAAMNSAVACYENLVSSADMGQLNRSKEEIRTLCQKRVRYFTLLEYLRIHDFHRNAVEFEANTVTSLGMASLKVTQPGSSAALALNQDGVFAPDTYRNAFVKQDKPLTLNGYFVSDPVTDNLVLIFEAIGSFVDDMESLAKQGAFGG